MCHLPPFKAADASDAVDDLTDPEDVRVELALLVVEALDERFMLFDNLADASGDSLSSVELEMSFLLFPIPETLPIFLLLFHDRKTTILVHKTAAHSRG